MKPRKNYKPFSEKSRSKKPSIPSENKGTRLNKHLSNAGICSRREADGLIAMGMVQVNGKVITEMGFKVQAKDDVRYDGQRISGQKPVYVLLNKPKGFVATSQGGGSKNQCKSSFKRRLPLESLP
ncbi:MAG: S4 domain-containing protein [Flavobacteriaceae bacterium]